MSGSYWDYTVVHEAWYAEAAGVLAEGVKAEIILSNHGDDPRRRRVIHEFVVHWHVLDSRLVPRMKVFDEALEGLQELIEERDFLSAVIGLGKDLTPTELAELLSRLGFADVTPREEPPRIRRQREERKPCSYCGAERPISVRNEDELENTDS